jgi:hypothetical protein
LPLAFPKLTFSMLGEQLDQLVPLGDGELDLDQDIIDGVAHAEAYGGRR